MLLNRPYPLQIGNFRVTEGVYRVERVDRRTGLGINSKKRDQDILAVKTAKHIIKQSDTVRGLKFNQCVSRVRFVVDGDARGKFNAHGRAKARALRFLDRWAKIEGLVLECLLQRLFYQVEIARTRNGSRFRIANTENAKQRIVVTWKNIGTQD